MSMPSEDTHATSAPPEATNVPQGDEAALRTLLERQRAFYPALRRDDCPPETFAEFLRVGGLIDAVRRRLGPVRYHAIRTEVLRGLE